MKQLLICTMALASGIVGLAQTNAVLTNLKDSWGTEISYRGEVKNKIPNGLGIAIYKDNSTASYYAGYFLNGQYNGKGVLLFNDGSFLSGDWKNGKLSGNGSSLNKDGDLFVGQYVDGTKEGKGTMFYKDNGFLQGSFHRDNYEGRSVFIGHNGDVVTDNIYHSSKKDGTGYQYETGKKQLFEGLWKEGDWVNAQAAVYYSFLKSPEFYAEKTDNQILVGGINKDRKLNDTAFFYDLNNKKRYFGRYENGFLKNGLIIRDDSTRFIGGLNEKGAIGYGAFYKIGKFYDEGPYAADYLTGPNCLSIDLKKKSVYYGGMVAGTSEGKAFFVDEYKTLFVGDYSKGKFTGNGYRVSSEGVLVKGTWDDGYSVKVTSIIDRNGDALSLEPRSMSEAITALHEDARNYFDDFAGQPAEDDQIDDDNQELDEVRQGFYNVPGASGNYILTNYLSDLAYVSVYMQTTDAAKAIAKYNQLCKLVQSASVSKTAGASPVKLEGSTETASAADALTISKYHFAGENSDAEFHVMVVLRQVKGNYKVYLAFGPYDLIDNWSKVE